VEESPDVDEQRRRLDAELHQVDEVRPAREYPGPVASRELACLRQRFRPHVVERSHPAASLTASTMFTYAPQRQRFPLIRSRISRASSVGAARTSGLTTLGHPFATSSRRPTAEQI